MTENGLSANRFVVLGDESTSPTAGLIASLRSRDIPLMVESDAAGVMAALGHEQVTAVVIVQPDALSEVDSLAAAMRRFHPQVHCHGYEPASERRAAHLFPLWVDDRKPRATDNAYADELGSELNPRCSPDSASDHIESDIIYDPGIALSAEELALLLGDEPM